MLSQIMIEIEMASEPDATRRVVRIGSEIEFSSGEDRLVWLG